MRQSTIQLDEFAGGTGYKKRKSITLDTGSTYDVIYLKTTNVNADQIEKITMTIDGDTKVDIFGSDLLMLEAFRGIYAEAGVFCLRFADIKARTQDGVNLTGYVTNPGENIILTIHFGPATAQQTADGVSPEVEAWADMRPNLLKDGKMLRRLIDYRLYRDDIAADKTGKVNFKTFDRGPRIRALHFDTPRVTDLEIKRDKITRYEAPKFINDMRLQQIGQRVPQEGFFHFDPIVSNYAVADLLQTNGASFVISPTVSTAGAIPVLFETLELA